MEVIMLRKIIFPITLTFASLITLCTFAHATIRIDADVADGAAVGPISNLPPVDMPWDVMFYSPAGVTCDDNQLLGAEFADGQFYVTGGNNATDPNQVYILDDDGNLLDQFEQWESTGWGWRDLAYDGEYLYGSVEFVIEAFDLMGNPVPEMNIDGPISPNRALAYDPVTDHFWTASFGGPLYEFDREGNVIWSGASGLTAVYGAAWDEDAVEGPFLWLFDQNGNPQTTICQFDPLDHVLTGYDENLQLLGYSTSQIAGGLFYTDEWDPNFTTMGGVTQGTPDDMIFMLEMYPNSTPQIDITLVPFEQPIQIPQTGGSFEFYAFATNNEAISIYGEAWIYQIDPEGQTSSPLLGPVSLTLEPGPVGYYRIQDVPATALPGSYQYIVSFGDYPTIALARDTIVYEKLETGDGAVVAGWQNNGDPFDVEDIVTSESIPAEYALHSAYPNPFNPTTTISYSLPEAGKVALIVYDLQGRIVAELVNGFEDVGIHEAVFDGTGLASGVYIYSLHAGDFSANGKMIMMK